MHRKFFLVSIFLLVIVAIGAASASEDISDDASASIEPTDNAIAESVEEIQTNDNINTKSIEEIETDNSQDILTDGAEKIDFNVTIYRETTSLYSDIATIESKGKNNGTINVYLNDEKKLNFSVENGTFERIHHKDDSWENITTKCITLSDLGVNDWGDYNIKVKFLNQTGEETQLGGNNTRYLVYNINYAPLYEGINEIFNISVELPKELTGTVTAFDESQTIFGSSPIINGIGNVYFSLPEGYQKYYIQIRTNKCTVYFRDYVNVIKNFGNVAVSIAPIVLDVGGTATLSLNSPYKGDLLITVDGVERHFEEISSLTYPLSGLALGTHTVRVHFEARDPNDSGTILAFYGNTFTITVKTASGSSGSSGSSSSSTVKKTAKTATKIVASKKTFKAKVKVKKYVASLKAGKKALKGMALSLKIGKKTFKAKTNKKGKATFKITKFKKKGKYKATIKFAGNKNYKASSKTVKITIKK